MKNIFINSIAEWILPMVCCLRTMGKIFKLDEIEPNSWNFHLKKNPLLKLNREVFPEEIVNFLKNFSINSPCNFPQNHSIFYIRFPQKLFRYDTSDERCWNLKAFTSIVEILGSGKMRRFQIIIPYVLVQLCSIVCTCSGEELQCYLKCRCA